MPKPYMPTTPTLTHHHNHHPTSTFRNYRTNNKLLYTPQYFNNNNNNFARQNMENLNKLAQQQHVPLTQLQPQQIQPMQMVYTSAPLAVKVNTPTMEYMNIVNYNTKVGNNNDYEENEITNTVTKCGRKTKDDSNNSGSDVLYYYCNNRITNYKNPAEQQQPLYSIHSSTTTTTSTTSSSTTTTTTEAPAPSTTTFRAPTTIKSLDNDYDLFTTEKALIFLPTPNAPLENSFTPVASAFRDQNSLNDLDTIADGGDFKPQRYKSRFRKYEDTTPLQQRQRQSNYNNIKRQQFYTTLAPTAQSASYDGMKLHSFFTIEDAVTRAPEMQVFNDPYQAYRHARRHHNNKHLRQNYQTTTMITTTKETPTTTSFNVRPKFKSFFDDLDEEYIIPENTAHYDYSLYNKPQKSSYYKESYKLDNKFPQPNQILDHTYKPTADNLYFNEGDVYVGKPKIKEHHFGIFKAIASTSSPSITTYKPYNNIRDLFLTTPKVESSFTFNPKTITFTTTTETIPRYTQGKVEIESTTFNLKANELGTTPTSLPITTTTTRKSPRILLKTPLNLRPTNTFKYTKPRNVLKSYKNLTTTTTTKATPTLKKVSKYRRQYKGKKLKQFKHLYTTTPSTTSTSSTTTTEIPTTLETITKRQSFRVLPTTIVRTTTTTSTEEPITRKVINSRTTDSTKIKKSRQQITSSSTEKPNRNKLKSIRTSTTPLTIKDITSSSTRRPSHRRGTKRANIFRNEPETKTTSITRKTGNKRRRLSVTSTSTTAKPFLTRSTSTTTTTTTTTSTTPLPPPIRKSSTTSTTMKSIMRIANSKARTKNNNEFKSAIRSNDINDDRLTSRTSATSTMANINNIPPLPIEIYFKKSQNAKI